MAKKEKAKKKKQEKLKDKHEEEKVDRGGFPEDVDFKKNLGCGG